MNRRQFFGTVSLSAIMLAAPALVRAAATEQVDPAYVIAARAVLDEQIGHWAPQLPHLKFGIHHGAGVTHWSKFVLAGDIAQATRTLCNHMFYPMKETGGSELICMTEVPNVWTEYPRLAEQFVTDSNGQIGVLLGKYPDRTLVLSAGRTA
jgi:hypothetical protein